MKIRSIAIILFVITSLFCFNVHSQSIRFEASSLQDIGSIGVFIEPPNQNAQKINITKENLQAFVELKLRQNAIPIINMDDFFSLPSCTW